jgi:hypothetical protein
MGVSTPSAAAVAAATMGLAMLVHTPKGITLAIGAKFMMVAAGIEVAMALGGVVIRVEGAAPKLHMSVLPPLTSIGIISAPPAMSRVGSGAGAHVG